MGAILLNILLLVFMFVLLIGILAVLKKYVFSKIRINKYIPLAIAIVGFIAQFALKISNSIGGLCLSAVIIIFFFWFLDIHQTGGPKKQPKKIVMKPKAKPNRVKNNK
ncbi:hypothetical protein [uncultured Clostridium sp.]|uniref:hypothetical protein n=1 Tax=uncultured Clostridium sp. TaxID=59620 RepID=UPI0025FC32A9|nr:hypothetical protein [uncultured Clostridium sp.]